MTNNTYKTPDFFMSLEKGSDIARCDWSKGAVINLDLARETQEAVKRLSGGKRVGLLVDLSNVKSITYDARNFYSTAEGVEAVSLLAKSLVAKIIGNFFIGIKKDTVTPTRLFVSEEEAVAWLKEKLK